MASRRVIDEMTPDLIEKIREVLREELEAQAERDQQPANEIMDLKQAAGFVGIHPKTLARRAKEGKIPYHKIGTREYRFFKSELRESLRRVK